MEVSMPTILLVEDEQEFANIILKELEQAGFQTIHAIDGETALTHHHNDKLDLIILDWMLPGMDGLDVLRTIRKSSQIPILMLTAKKTEIDRVIGLEVGADDYLTKPFGMRELIARVRALLRRINNIQQIILGDQENTGVAIQFSSLHINPQTYTTTLDGEPIELTKNEFKLLHLLVRFPGRVFSRTYLLDTVWGNDCVVVDRVVDNTILHLRQKLGAFGDQIKTVWGIGYKIMHEP
jgi:DNA-binding response OmpR family regulator